MRSPNLLDEQNRALNYLMSPDFYHIREILYGGAKGGGKSFLGCLFTGTMCMFYPGVSYFVARKNLTDLRKHTIPSFFEAFKIQGITPDQYKFNGQDNIFNFANGSRILLISTEYQPGDPLYERFGSMQNTGGWIEEGGEHSEDAYNNLKISIGRCKNLEYNLPFKLLITANPKKGWMSENFIKNRSKDKRFIPSFAKDNIFLPPEYIKTLNGLTDKVARQRLLMGNWDYDDDDNSLLSYEKISDCFTNSFVDSGEMFISSDIAITNDKFVVIVWSGMRIKEIVAINNASKPVETMVNNVLTRVVDYTPLKNEYDRLTVKWKVPRSNICYDADGIGKDVKDFLRGSVGLHTGQKSIYPEYFNLRSELLYKLAEIINGNRLFFDCYVEPKLKETIISELGLIKTHAEIGEKLRIIPKSDMKDIIKRSPDLLDALAYRMLFKITRKK